MLVAPLRKVDQERGLSPMICAKTGVPTTITMDIPVVTRSRWPWLLLPVNFTAFVLARAFAKETESVRVAIAPGAWERHRHRTWIVVAGALIGIGLSLAVFPTASLALIALAFVVHAAMTKTDWVSASVDGDTYLIRGVHPSYLRAALGLSGDSPTGSGVSR